MRGTQRCTSPTQKRWHARAQWHQVSVQKQLSTESATAMHSQKSVIRLTRRADRHARHAGENALALAKVSYVSRGGRVGPADLRYIQQKLTKQCHTYGVLGMPKRSGTTCSKCCTVRTGSRFWHYSTALWPIDVLRMQAGALRAWKK